MGRLSTLSSFYKYCQTEDILDKNPALNVRRPRVHDESRTLGLDRNELGALLVQAGLGDLRDGALITLLALNGLRISEAERRHRRLVGQRGHRTLAIARKVASTSPSRLRHARRGHWTCTSVDGRSGRSFSASKAGAWIATARIGWSSGW